MKERNYKTSYSPALVPIMRCFVVKVTTLGVSRLDSLLRRTSTPAQRQGRKKHVGCIGTSMEMSSWQSSEDQKDFLPPLRASAMQLAESPTSMPATLMTCVSKIYCWDGLF